MDNKFNPKVSIVIPVYNGSNYVKEAIDSALAQTYKNLEIIVVNDGSTDDGKTDKICKSYGKKIRYFKKENGGVASALNMAIDKMEGEYFSWLSHDDKYLPEKIEKQIEYLSTAKSKKIALYMNYGLIDPHSKPISNGSLDHEMLSNKPEYALLRGSVNGITLLIPRQAFKDHGGFDLELKCTQDYEMWRRIMKTYKFVHLPISLTQTRIHPLQDSNKHPNVQTEGNPLWIGMMEDLSLKDKERLEGTEYNFYLEMSRFLRGTPYSGALEFSENKLQQISDSSKDKTKNILVSVIIPFHNRIELLEKSIDSVLKQTHKNFELLLIDDGSTEDLSTIKAYERKDKRIRIINLGKNIGAAGARNVGINEAEGQYIAFLDSDDEFMEGKIENQLNVMYLADYNISHTSYIRQELKTKRKMSSGELHGKVIPSIIASCPIATPTVMIKRSFLVQYNFKFLEEFQIGEDICFWLEILRKEMLLGITQPYTIVNVNRGSAINNTQKQIVGVGNILNFVLSDREYKNYYKEIAHLCKAYLELTGGISGGSGISEKILFNNPVSKLFYLFKYQGIFLTIKKLFWKYGPKAMNKLKRIVNEKK